MEKIVVAPSGTSNETKFVQSTDCLPDNDLKKISNFFSILIKIDQRSKEVMNEKNKPEVRNTA